MNDGGEVGFGHARVTIWGRGGGEGRRERKSSANKEGNKLPLCKHRERERETGVRKKQLVTNFDVADKVANYAVR